MKLNKSCSNCIRGTKISINKDILCREKGIVSPDYVCMKHRIIPDSKLEKPVCNKCIDCENFIIGISNSADSSSLGLCQLFSVRQFDGTQKNACSKFVRRLDVEVV